MPVNMFKVQIDVGLRRRLHRRYGQLALIVSFSTYPRSEKVRTWKSMRRTPGSRMTPGRFPYRAQECPLSLVQIFSRAVPQPGDLCFCRRQRAAEQVHRLGWTSGHKVHARPLPTCL